MVSDPKCSPLEAASQELDLRGLKCPLPALLAKRALLRASAGTVLDIVADDPLAAVDIPHMCGQEAFEIVASRRDGNLVRFRISRSTAALDAPPTGQDAQ